MTKPLENFLKPAKVIYLFQEKDKKSIVKQTVHMFLVAIWCVLLSLKDNNNLGHENKKTH